MVIFSSIKDSMILMTRPIGEGVLWLSWHAELITTSSCIVECSSNSSRVDKRWCLAAPPPGAPTAGSYLSRWALKPTLPLKPLLVRLSLEVLLDQVCPEAPSPPEAPALQHELVQGVLLVHPSHLCLEDRVALGDPLSHHAHDGVSAFGFC